jgi:hypothetical protein
MNGPVWVPLSTKRTTTLSLAEIRSSEASRRTTLVDAVRRLTAV